MTRTVNGERLFDDPEKEVLRKMLWQVADFSGVEVLTYALMTNHFHVLVRIREADTPSDAELLRRYQVLYPKPTKYQQASIQVLAGKLAAGGDDAAALRRRLQARMGDVSEFMKTLKQRFSVWFNRTHDRFGTLWADRFKSVLVEGRGPALQIMAAYIDLNPVRAGLVDDPKDYRFSGYGEAVGGGAMARAGLKGIWVNAGYHSEGEVLSAHRMSLYGKASDPRFDGGAALSRAAAVRVLEKEKGELPLAAVLRCRVRYFTDGAILGSEAFVRDHAAGWQVSRSRKYSPAPQRLRGADWNGLTVVQGLREAVFG